MPTTKVHTEPETPEPDELTIAEAIEALVSAHDRADTAGGYFADAIVDLASELERRVAKLAHIAGDLHDLVEHQQARLDAMAEEIVTRRVTVSDGTSRILLHLTGEGPEIVLRHREGSLDSPAVYMSATEEEASVMVVAADRPGAESDEIAVTLPGVAS